MSLFIPVYFQVNSIRRKMTALEGTVKLSLEKKPFKMLAYISYSEIILCYTGCPIIKKISHDVLEKVKKSL